MNETFDDLLFWAYENMTEDEYMQLLTMDTQFIIEYILERMG